LTSSTTCTCEDPSLLTPLSPFHAWVLGAWIRAALPK
jgi:hypothetical protein